ncbi:MAG: DUF975 family protein [Coriobacteriales bacterium]|nr:DUF975 family protein [Coriobacteriales bacterium]
MPKRTGQKWKITAIKRRARQPLRRNFAVCFLACLVLGFITANPSALSDNANASMRLLESVGEIAPDTPLASAADNVLSFLNGIKAATSLGSDSSAGVISTIYTGVRSADSPGGAFLNFINSSVFGNQLSRGLINGMGIITTVMLFLFISEILVIGSYRLFLENRLYPRTSLSRIFFVYQLRRVFPAVRVVFSRYLRLSLWALTIVGLPLKYYSYYLVPLIQAENPGIASRTIFKLSESMMRGHRFHTFLLDLSFIGWGLLSLLTLGIVGYVWLNPFRTATQAELYATLRAQALQKKLAGTEYLQDEALFAIQTEATDAKAEKEGIKGDKVAAEAPQTYPFILRHPLEQRIHSQMTIELRERYSLINLLLMFFLFSFIGWAWECAIAFLQSGTFINRGSMYGPWIPIYGLGGVAILVFLNRFNKQPLLCFFAIIALCGVIEYAGATIVWNLRHIKYWDYSGYFFNIQGRICLEGLLAFGILGMAGLYFIAPITDALLQTVPRTWRERVCVLLVAAFGADFVITTILPRTGTGITTTVLSTPPPDSISHPKRL